MTSAPGNPDLNHNIFFKSIVSERVKLKPSELHRDYKDVILEKLKAACEGKCTRNGYVKRGSIRLHKVSAGRIETISLNGDVNFVVLYQCEICNPAQGDVIKSTVVNTNKLGVLSHSGTTINSGMIDPISGEEIKKFVPVIQILVPRQLFVSDVDLDRVSIGDTINVEVLGKKFKLNGKKIHVTARAVAHDVHVSSGEMNIVDDPDEIDSSQAIEDDNQQIFNEDTKVDDEEEDDENGTRGGGDSTQRKTTFTIKKKRNEQDSDDEDDDEENVSSGEEDEYDDYTNQDNKASRENKTAAGRGKNMEDVLSDDDEDFKDMVDDADESVNYEDGASLHGGDYADKGDNYSSDGGESFNE